MQPTELATRIYIFLMLLLQIYLAASSGGGPFQCNEYEIFNLVIVRILQ